MSEEVKKDSFSLKRILFMTYIIAGLLIVNVFFTLKGVGYLNCDQSVCPMKKNFCCAEKMKMMTKDAPCPYSAKMKSAEAPVSK